MKTIYGSLSHNIKSIVFRICRVARFPITESKFPTKCNQTSLLYTQNTAYSNLEHREKRKRTIFCLVCCM